MERDQLYNLYHSLAERNHALLIKENKTLTGISVLRFVTFFSGIFISVAAFSFSTAAGIVILIMSISVFLFLVKIYAEHSVKRDFFSSLETINLDEIKALEGDQSAFNKGEKWINTDHDFSHDIDLFGDNSLFQFLDRTVTGHGREKLAKWLSDPYSIAGELRIRQEAISELSSKFEWRQNFIASGMGRSLEKEDIQNIIEWLDDEQGWRLSLFFKIMLWIGPGITITSLIFHIFGLLPYQVFTTFFIINLLIISAKLKTTGKIHDQVTKKHAFLQSLSSLMETFSNEPFNSVLLSDVRKEISSDDFSAVNTLKRLSRIIQSFDSRLNIFVGFLLNGLLMWDLQCIKLLGKWKEKSREEFPVWLDKIGEIDALISLANFAFNNQAFSFPVISENGPVFSAGNMGHPLIGYKRRICNDFIINEKGKVIIVTGANMSGKSTFLRTVAVNLILAMSGSPVCASEMTLRPVRLFTSMRTTDSLSENESYFYAELKRLRILKMKLEEGEPVFFVLDEILKGTNSADKSAGSKQYIRKIIELGGTGLIATHDISLCELENEFPDRIVNKCFELEIEGEKISFDYKLVDGVTRKMNAAILMKQMGIA